jgi:hypothetical protein
LLPERSLSDFQFFILTSIFLLSLTLFIGLE